MSFYCCSGIERVNLGNGVISIGKRSFEGCSKLLNVTIGNSLSSIGNSAFMYCNLKNITCTSAVPLVVNTNGCFASFYDKATLKVPDESIEAYREAEVWKNFSNIVGYRIGDVDGDSRISIADVIELIDSILAGTGEDNPCADVDGDGVITISDVIELIDIVLGI